MQMHQSVSAQHTFLWVACISFHGLHSCKAALWSQSDVGQKGKIVNIPPAPLYHHQQLSVDISPFCAASNCSSKYFCLLSGQ